MNESIKSESKGNFLAHILIASFEPEKFFKAISNNKLHWVQSLIVFCLQGWLLYFLALTSTNPNFELGSFLLGSILALFVAGPITYFFFVLLALVSFGKKSKPRHLIGWMSAPSFLILISWFCVQAFLWFLGLFPNWYLEELEKTIFMLPALGLYQIFSVLFIFGPIIWPLFVLYNGIKQLAPNRKSIFWIWAVVYVALGFNLI